MTERRYSGPILAVDHGETRIGIAVWEPSTGVRPAGVLRHRSRAADAQRLARIAAERGAQWIVVGLPLNADGTEGPQARRARAFADLLAQEATMPVAMFDERGTSQEAVLALGLGGRPLDEREKQLVDQRAAMILLERFLAGEVE